MSARELGWVLLGVCSTLACARDGVAASPDTAKPIAVSVAPPVASSSVEAAPSEPPAPPVELGDRVALYGLSLEVPVGWRDDTIAGFDSEGGVFSNLSISHEPEVAGHVEEWLSTMREELRGEGAQPSPVRSYAHSELAIRGFRADFPQRKSANNVHVVVVLAPGEQALNWYVICRASCDAALADLLRSLRLAEPEVMPPLEPASVANGRYAYRAFEWEFEMNERLTNPQRFSVEQVEGRGRLWCTRSGERAELEVPEWALRFSIAHDAVLSRAIEDHQTIVGQANPPLEPPVFTSRHDLVTVHEGGARRALMYAQATTPIGNAFFSCTFTREGAHRESLALWNAMLSSARRD